MKPMMVIKVRVFHEGDPFPTIRLVTAEVPKNFNFQLI